MTEDISKRLATMTTMQLIELIDQYRAECMISSDKLRNAMLVLYVRAQVTSSFSETGMMPGELTVDQLIKESSKLLALRRV